MQCEITDALMGQCKREAYAKFTGTKRRGRPQFTMTGKHVCKAHWMQLHRGGRITVPIQERKKRTELPQRHIRQVEGGYVDASAYPNAGEPDWKHVIEEACGDVADHEVSAEAFALRIRMLAHHRRKAYESFARRNFGKHA